MMFPGIKSEKSIKSECSNQTTNICLKRQKFRPYIITSINFPKYYLLVIDLNKINTYYVTIMSLVEDILNNLSSNDFFKYILVIF